MSSVPVRYPSGVASRPADHLYGNFPRPDPSQVWQFFDDFNGFTISAAGVTGWHLDEVNTGTGPTLAMIGEAGPEAVIPLSKAGTMGGNTINVTVTSADPNAVVAALQQYVRLNNRLPANAIG